MTLVYISVDLSSCGDSGVRMSLPGGSTEDDKTIVNPTATSFVSCGTMYNALEHVVECVLQSDKYCPQW